MPRRRPARRIRFDLRGDAFVGAADEYRAALRKAEKLWRRLQRADVRRDHVKEERARRELAQSEDRLDAARAALLEHTKKIAEDPMRTHVKRLGLGACPADVA